jgi:hypothetical protein
LCLVCTAITTQEYIGSVTPVSRRNPQHRPISRVFIPVFIPLPGLLVTIVIKRWVRSRPNCLGAILEFPAISSSAYSLLEERTPEKPPSCSESVTPQRVQRSSGSFHREIASGFVPVPTSGTFNFHYLARFNSMLPSR